METTLNSIEYREGHVHRLTVTVAYGKKEYTFPATYVKESFVIEEGYGRNCHKDNPAPVLQALLDFLNNADITGMHDCQYSNIKNKA
jgi:hypothetical protein